MSVGLYAKQIVMYDVSKNQVVSGWNGWNQMAEQRGLSVKIEIASCCGITYDPLGIVSYELV